MKKIKDIAWETLSIKEIVQKLGTNLKQGLRSEDIAERQQWHGKNIIGKEKEAGIFGKTLKQLKNPLVFILLGAGAVTLFLEAYLDAIVIFIALFINVVVGTFQEERASRSFEKLNKSQESNATVIRDGKKVVISSKDLVPGDIVVLLGGSHVPADIRIVEAKNLSINEAILTGEWLPVSKEENRILKSGTSISEQKNMAWMGTMVSAGYGEGLVVATGEKTEVGMIASQLTIARDRTTPLQQNIRKIARFLVYVIVFAILIIFVLGLLRGEPIGDMLLLSIAVAVAAIPAGLPAAVTVVLALGMEAILTRGGLVRNLLAAETLGATTVILTDKTGTLTEAKMKLTRLYTLESLIKKSEEWTDDDKELLTSAVLASDAFVEEDDEAPGKLTVHGRPIERSIVLAGLEVGISQEEFKDDKKRVDFLQFESWRRFGASLNTNGEHKKKRLYLTGSPEYLLEHSTYIFKGGKQHKMTSEERDLFKRIQEEKSEEGMRFIGISCKDVSWDSIPSVKPDDVEKILTSSSIFIGFISFSDPIRKDVEKSIENVKKAGARVIMLTGDNPKTAYKVAKDVGIAKGGYPVLSGSDIAKYDDKELFEVLQNTNVFARVLPDQKLRIVRVLKNNNEIVAMTGDGVNDAPALRSANIGVAVGSGTEVAKEAADIILLDNSFSIIVAAIEEGRRILDNLKKIVAYLLSTNFSEIFLIIGSLVVGAPLPLLPAQILWSNIIEEGFMSFSFAFEKSDPKSMERDPRSHSAKNILTVEVKRLIFVIGIITGLTLLILYFILLYLELPIKEIRTFMFVALSIDSMFFALSLKSFHVPIWKINIFSNKFLVIALLLSVALLFAALKVPYLQTLLSLTSLTSLEIMALVGIGFFDLVIIEASKYFLFIRNRK